MIFEIKKLLAANMLKIVVTNAGEVYQVELTADDAVTLTVTGSKEEIENGIVQYINDHMKDIHEKKQDGLKAKIASTAKSKPVTTKPVTSTKPSIVTDKGEDDTPEDDDTPNDDTPADEVKETPKPAVQQTSMF
jgi:hypothetical protein